MDEYLESIRALEQRVERTSKWTHEPAQDHAVGVDDVPPLVDVGGPGGIGLHCARPVKRRAPSRGALVEAAEYATDGRAVNAEFRSPSPRNGLITMNYCCGIIVRY